MKVNITGFGAIPGLGSIAPVYNVDMDHAGIRRMMNFPAFRVFDVETGTIITRSNVNDVLASKTSKSVSVMETPKKKDETQTAEKAVDEPVKVEILETPVEEVKPEEAEVTEVELDTTTVVGDDSAEIVEEVSVVENDEQNVVPERQHPYNNNNYNRKNKKRH